MMLQKLIELIKQNRILESIEFAQKELTPFVEKNVKSFLVKKTHCMCSQNNWKKLKRS